MKLFCQKDARWSGMMLGESSVTVGDKGCVASCLAMLSGAWNGSNGITPADVASRADWFTKDDDRFGGGLVIWGKLGIHGLKFEGRVYRWDGLPVMYASMVRKDMAAMMEVKMADGQRHWVIAVRWDPIAGWRVADPLTGKYRWIPKHWVPVGYALFSSI